MTLLTDRPSPAEPQRRAEKPKGNSRIRRDIEGLRAVATFLVLPYHAGLMLFPGGYVGVDVFFVISGFVITGQLIKEVDRDGHREPARVLRPAGQAPAPGQRRRPRRDRDHDLAVGAADPVGDHRRRHRRLVPLRRELAAGRPVRRLPRRGRHAVRRAALLVAVGGGAVLLRLAAAAARRGARRRQAGRQPAGRAARRPGRGRRTVAALGRPRGGRVAGAGLLRHHHADVGVHHRRVRGDRRDAAGPDAAGAGHRARLDRARDDPGLRPDLHRRHDLARLLRAAADGRHRAGDRGRCRRRRAGTGGDPGQPVHAVHRLPDLLALPLALAAADRGPRALRLDLAARRPGDHGVHDRAGVPDLPPRGEPAAQLEADERAPAGRAEPRRQRHAGRRRGRAGADRRGLRHGQHARRRAPPRARPR